MFFDFNKGYNNNSSIKLTSKPIIAISANIIDENSALHFAYSRSIIDAGALPIIIPANCDSETIISLMGSIDGVLFSGGADIDAAYFNEENIANLTEIVPERDYNEFMILRAAIDFSIPIFGICRGCQLINIALGGTIYQDLPSLYPEKPLEHSVLKDKHLPVHPIEIREQTILHKIIGASSVSVNSRHHQAIKDIAPSLKLAATSSDGVVEAIEGYPTHKIIAVQWHPENMATDGDDIAMERLFRFFVEEARTYQTAKTIHNNALVIDSHCDTPMLYDTSGFDLSVRNSDAKVDIIKMQEGRVDATITVIYTPQSTPKEIVKQRAFDMLDRFKTDILKNSDKVALARTVEDVVEAKKRGVKSIILGIENGVIIGDELSVLDRLSEEGVAYITLCHNGSNQICDSAVGEQLYDGVSSFGEDVIKRMNKLGVTVDISHSSEKSTFDALNVSSKPIIASHSSCKALCDHPRNLSDRAIKAIAAKGGVVQVCGYSWFLREDGRATILDIIAHIEHIVSLTGYDHVGIGSDFDGDGGVDGFDGSNEFVSLTVELLRRSHSPENISKILGGNIARVLANNMQK